MPAHTKMRRTEERQASAESTVLGLPGPPEPSYPLGYLSEGRPLPTRFGIEREVLFPAEPAAFQRVCWASVLYWLTKLNTGVQISFLQVKKPLLPGECYSSQLKGSWTSPQMLCPKSESPKLREQTSTAMQKHKGVLLLARARAPVSSSAVES